MRHDVRSVWLVVVWHGYPPTWPRAAVSAPGFYDLREAKDIFTDVATFRTAIGVYGVISYEVSQRAKEIGIRMARAADRHAVLDLVLRGGSKMTAVGVAAGAALGAGIARVASGLLFGVSTYDPATYAGLAALLLVAAVSTAYPPARRGTALDPLSSLRR